MVQFKRLYRSEKYFHLLPPFFPSIFWLSFFFSSIFSATRDSCIVTPPFIRMSLLGWVTNHIKKTYKLLHKICSRPSPSTSSPEQHGSIFPIDGSAQHGHRVFPVAHRSAGSSPRRQHLSTVLIQDWIASGGTCQVDAYMPRSSKTHVVQSHDEYMIEEHSEHDNSTQQYSQSSDSEEVLTKGDDDDDGDSDANSQDENGETIKRGKRKLKDIWNLPKGQRIVVECNDLNQPIGKEVGHLGNFLGTVARNGSLCSLIYKDWRKLIGEKDKRTNEEKNKKDILEQVKMRFLYLARMEKYILRTIGERWRQHKSNLKSIYFDANKSTDANNTNVLKGVSKDQWIALVDNWMSQKAKDISEQNRKNCAMKKTTHTAGTKSFARNREELRRKDPEKKNPHRAVLYIHTHQHKRDKNMNEHVDDLKRLLVQQPDLADTSRGKTTWKGDALNQILGVDKPGHVHGLGLVPHPNQVFDVSTSRRFQNTHLTSLEDTSSEDIVSVRLHIKKLEQHIKNKDAEILEVKEKTKNLERPTNKESFDPISMPQDAPCVDGTNSKRKRVYGDFPTQEVSMVAQPKDLMSKHNDSHDSDLQPSRNPSAGDKETTHG